MVYSNQSGEPETIRSTLLGQVVESISDAVRDEIAAIRVEPTRNFEVTDGRLIYEKGSQFLYSFKTDLSLPIPPETPVSLEIDGQLSSNGVLVSLQEFDILLQLKTDLGQIVPRARVSSQPSFIYEALKERLQDELERDARDIDIPLALVDLQEIPISENHSAADKGIEILKNLGIPSLNPNNGQIKAIRRCAGSRLQFVWGPPGTGKTANLAQVVRTLVLSEEKVLVLAHANVAVDVAMLRVADAFSGSRVLSNGGVLRLGIPQLPGVLSRDEILPEAIIERTQPELVAEKRFLELRIRELTNELLIEVNKERRDHHGQNLEDVRLKLSTINQILREALTNLVAEAKVIGATLSRLAIDDLVWNSKPSAVIVDETSMANFPSVFAASLRASDRMILFGDFRQLPPIHIATTAATERWFGNDAFEIAGVVQRLEDAEEDARITLLNEQYRMTPSIAEIVSILSYNGKLKTAPGVAEAVEHLSRYSPFPGEEVLLINTEGFCPACFKEPKVGSFSRVNPIHAALTMSIASMAISSGCDDLAIISPYKAQTQVIAAMCRVLLPIQQSIAATVHRFQGSERDLVIFDLVDSPQQTGPSMLTGRDVDNALRLLNVAASRSRGKLIFLANIDFIYNTFSKTSPARKIINIIENMGLKRIDITQLENLIGNFFNWYNGWEQAQGEIAEDLSKVEDSIILNIPNGFSLNKAILSQLAHAAERRLKVTVFSNITAAADFEDIDIDIRLRNQPGGFFAFLDRKKIHFGGHSLLGYFVRSENKHIIENLYSMYLGNILKMPSPSADMEQRIDEICGRCRDCGAQSRPRKDQTGKWVVRCDSLKHSNILLTKEMLNELISVMNVKCSGCGQPAVVLQGNINLFIGCPNFRSGCPGSPPSLEELFGGE